jgi:hypothetical protein
LLEYFFLRIVNPLFDGIVENSQKLGFNSATALYGPPFAH